jgi:D-alanyl-D-alanine carboxypeptidase
MHRISALLLVAALSLAARAQSFQSPLFSEPITPLSPAQRTAMTGKSWRPGCPVPLDDLASVRVMYWGFDNQTHQGTLILHKRFAPEAAQIFEQLYAVHFPIRKVDLWSSYGSGVYAEQDVTVGFYCQKADDDPTQWSSHAWGIAIDLNPRENPFRNPEKGWWPAISAVFAPRDTGKGKILSGSPAFQAFARRGWAWGGFLPGEPDYMHFAKLTYGGSGNPLQRPYTVTGLEYTPGTAFEASQPK